ncbi:cytochrome P450 [Xylaria venustula]|nr:cytochrome P450 [Xylaria venustula]
MPLTAVLGVVEQLSWTQAAFTVAGALVLWYITSSIWAWYLLRHIPGPFFASFSHLWIFWATCTGRSEIILRTEQKKHGSVLRVAPNAVTIFDPETALRINSARSPYTRGGWYRGMRVDYRGDSVLSELSVNDHGKRKAKLAPAFAGKNVALLESKADLWIEALVHAIRARIAKGEETMDIGIMIQYFQVDLITELVIGKPWGDLKDDMDHFGYLKMNDFVIPAIQSVGFSPAGRTIYTSKWLMGLFGPKNTDSSGLGHYFRLIQDEVESRRSEHAGEAKESRDFIDEFLRHGLSATECQFDLALLLPAGTETSVMMIRGTLLLLMSSPRVYWKLKQEIKEAVTSGRISSPVTNEEAKSLEYAKSITREGLRLMLPVNLGFPKRVPDSGDTICGKFMPGGTEVYVNYGALMRCEEVFGKDADSFRPERFLGGGPDVAYMSKVVDLAFGGGRFMCLGKALAEIEINKIFVELFRNFDFQTATPEKPWTRKGYTTWTVHNFWARVTEDKTMGG